MFSSNELSNYFNASYSASLCLPIFYVSVSLNNRLFPPRLMLPAAADEAPPPFPSAADIMVSILG